MRAGNTIECDWFLATLRRAAPGIVVCTDADDDDDDELSEGDANSNGGGMIGWWVSAPVDDLAKPLSPLDDCDGLPCDDTAPSPTPTPPMPTDELVDSVDSDESTLAVSSVSTLSRRSCDEPSVVT